MFHYNYLCICANVYKVNIVKKKKERKLIINKLL